MRSILHSNRLLLGAAFLGLLSFGALAQTISPKGGTGGGGGTCPAGSAGALQSTDGTNCVGTNISGLVKGNGATAPNAAVSGVDYSPAGEVVLVNGSNPTIAAADWLSFAQYTILGASRTLTIPATSTLSTSGGLAVDANAAAVTVTANAADTIQFAGNVSASGGSVTLSKGAFYTATTDGAGHLYISNAATNVSSNVWAGQQSNSITTLSISTATFTPDGSNNNYALTLVHASCPCTLANPSATPVAGTAGVIEIVQSATGSDTIGTWGSDYIYAGGTSTISLSSGASAKDFLSYYVVDPTHILLTTAGLNATH